MITFVLLAAALTVAGVIAVAIPLLRRGTGSPTTPAPWAALAATVLLVIGSAVLYVSWSNWPWRAVIPADSPQSMVARLARQLERDPQNLDGWLMLGRSYIALQEYPLGLRAFERADRLSGGQNAEALTGEAEALVLTDESELNGRAGRLIERALVLAPDSGKALFFGGAVAARRGDLPLARARFVKLLGMDPPPNVRPLIEQQITAIDGQLGGGVAPASAASAPQQSAPNPGAVVRVNVQVVARIARSGNPVGASGDPLGEVTYQVGRDGLVSLVIDHRMP